MTDQTNKFLYNQGAEGPGGNGGGGNTGGLPPPKNFSTATFNFIGADGQVVKSVPIDKNYQAKYQVSPGAGEVGQNRIVARFTGDHKYAARSLDDFNIKVSDANGLNDNKSAQGTVNQIVAGAGVFISAPNGQGVVTIGTEPIDLTNFEEDLYEVNWSITGDSGYPSPYARLLDGIPGQFTAVGTHGSILRSRDGHNWTKLPWTTTTNFYSVSAETGISIPDQHMEYIAVGQNGKGFYGRLGSANGDGLQTNNASNHLTDQHGPIYETLVSIVTIPLTGNAPYSVPGQFTGGITDYVIQTQGASTSTGVPIYDLSGTPAHMAVMTNYKITSVETRRAGGGIPSLIFSVSANDQVQIKINMYVEDIRYTPGTSLTGKQPYRYYPIAVNNDGSFFVDPVTGKYGIPISPGYLIDQNSDIPPLTVTWLIPFPNGQYYFSPYVKVSDPVNNVSYILDYIPTDYWQGYAHDTSFTFTFPNISDYFDMTGIREGMFPLRVETWVSQSLYMAGATADYVFDAVVEIVP